MTTVAPVRVLADARVAPRRRNGWFAYSVPAVAAALFFFGATLHVFGDERAIFIAMGGLPLLAASLPLFFSAHREFGMWTYAIISIGIGYSVRLLYVYAESPSEAFIDNFFLRGESPSYFVYPTVLVSIGLVLMGSMYVLASGGERYSRPVFGELNVSTGRLYAVAGFFALMSIGSFFLFVQGTGGFDISNLSSKRTSLNTIDIGNDSSLRTFGELRYFASLGAVGYMFLLVSLLSKGRKLRTIEVGLLVGYLAIVLLLPFYSSNRADAMAPMLATVVVLARYGRRLNWRKLVVPAVAVMLIFNVMTALRSSGEVNVESVASVDVVTQFVDNTSITRSFADFSKTSHLIQRVPSQLEWKNGSTIAAYVVGPIPRSLWPGKPLISSGPIIGQQIYEQRRGAVLSTSGVPPGFFGEMWWNFGTVGLLVGSILLGFGLGRANRWSKSRGDIRSTVFFGAGLFSTISGFLAVGVGFALIELLTTWAGIILMYWMLGRPAMIVAAPREQLTRG